MVQHVRGHERNKRPVRAYDRRGDPAIKTTAFPARARYGANLEMLELESGEVWPLFFTHLGFTREDKPVVREMVGWSEPWPSPEDAPPEDFAFSDLPQDLTQLTDEQQSRIVDYLAKMPLKELRRRQDIMMKQGKTAYEQHLDRALENLHVMELLLADAIDKKVFGGP